MPTMKFKLTIEADGVDIFSQDLGFESLRGLVDMLPDIEKNMELFGHLAKCASTSVRKEVAFKENQNQNSIELLSRDVSFDVRRQLCCHEYFLKWASTDLLLAYIDSDIECAKIIASHIDGNSDIDTEKVFHVLCEHPDPGVRYAVVENWRVPKNIIKRFLSDPDANVRESALKTLE